MSCPIDTHGTRCQCTTGDAPPVATTEPAPAAETIRCACGKRATVHITYLPRPLPLFGSAVTTSVCSSCYRETLTRGQLLGQAAIPEAPS